MRKLPFDKKPKKPVSGKKIWSTAKTDREFSLYIRARDGKCLKCGRSDRRLSCSHFWGRRRSELRYEEDNCITLCWLPCHKFEWEKEKAGAYRDFMIQRLGVERYEELKRIFYQSKMKRSEAIEKCMELLSGN